MKKLAFLEFTLIKIPAKRSRFMPVFAPTFSLKNTRMIVLVNVTEFDMLVCMSLYVLP
jgi:hypothetical protein